MVCTPAHLCNPDMAIAACRAGEIGILDLGLNEPKDTITEYLNRLQRFSGSQDRWGVRWDMLFETDRVPTVLEKCLSKSGRIPILVLAGLKVDNEQDRKNCLQVGRLFAHYVLLECKSVEEAQSAEKAGYDGVILKGNEAGGYTGNQSCFILLQQACRRIKIPFWVQGGMGRHTAAAAILAGAAGVVLCEQLWLTRESPLTDQEKTVFKKMDGSETACLGKGKTFFRFFCRNTGREQRDLEARICRQDSWHTLLNKALLHPDGRNERLIPCGQDIGLAAHLADRYETVGSVLRAIRQNATRHIELAKSQNALAADADLAQLHKTRYPFVQGPMANISDTAAFCKAVAKAGALPCVALSALPAPQARDVLEQAQRELSGFPWAVGIMGFLPRALLDEQFKIIQDIQPPFAVIAGGRPGQVRKLESAGTCAYVHAPSPGLLSAFFKEGIRRFILEGRECGGHVGPLSSFILWESALNRLIDEPSNDLSDLCILFAGGIHDGLSAELVQTMAAQLIERGAKIGILMGTVYLFSREAVASGAITPAYQQQLLQCRTTRLLHSGSGHASCCIDTPFVQKFYNEKQKLVLSKKTDGQILQALETLNLGRLLLAAKGIVCRFEKAVEPGHTKHVLVSKKPVDESVQLREGLFMAGQVAQLHDQTIPLAQLHAGIAENSRMLTHRHAEQLIETEIRFPEKEDIAIVGIASIFPGADDVEKFWHNIILRRCAISEIPSSRWNIQDFYDPDRTLSDKTFSKWGGFLNDVAFDPKIYSMPPKMLESTDAVQLLALEITRRALQDAGYDRRIFPRQRTSVIFGAEGISDLAVEYAVRAMAGNLASITKGVPTNFLEKILDSLNTALPQWTSDSFPGILTNLISGRIANRFDLGGTNLTCQAACATSLAAMEFGVRQLRDHSCDMCLVGAVDLGNNPFGYIMFSRSQVLSPTGQSRPLDNAADGIVLGEGAACLVLKRLSDAEKDGDQIYAVIKGVGSSSDGRKRSLVAPDPDGQVRALRGTYSSSRIDPASVRLLELHGTGTVLGDQVEIDATKQVFNGKNGGRPACAIGSVKSNIGHTKVAAGMASMIKVALSLKHKVLPPTINVTVPNKKIDLVHSPFYINTQVRPWVRTAQDPPRRAGVSSFGFGGANFHVLLEEYQNAYRPDTNSIAMPRDAEIFIFTDHDSSTVCARLQQLGNYLDQNDQPNLAQLAFAVYNDSAKSSSAQNACRLNLVASSHQELKNKIDTCLKQVIGSGKFIDPKGIYYNPPGPESTEAGPTGKICFLFPGQGSQRLHMLRDLVFAGPNAHDIIAAGDSVTANCFEHRLSDYIFPPPVFSDSERRRQQNELNFSHIAQPALAVANLVGLDVLEHYGFKPDYLAGHSFGEYVALCAAGCLSRDALIRLSEIRGRIVSRISSRNSGTMAAVQADRQMTGDVIKKARVSAYIANYNAPDQTVIAGRRAEIEKALAEFQSQNIMARRIAVTAAFHTPLMLEAGGELKDSLTETVFQSPRIQVVGNTTAEPYPHDPKQIRKLLERHICEPVRFEDQIRRLYDDGARIFIETGAGKILSNLVGRILAHKPHATFWLDVPGTSGWVQLAHLLAHGSILGLDVNLSKWFAGRRLKAQGTAEYIREEQTAKNPGPTTWRICGGRATPWNHAGSNPYKKRLKIDDAITDEYPAQSSPGQTQDPGFSDNKNQLKKPIGKDESAMKNTTPYQIMPETNAYPEKECSDDLSFYFSQCQKALGQFMDMQHQQQKTTQLFINIQEKMLEAACNAGSVKSSDHLCQDIRSKENEHSNQNLQMPTFIPLGSPPAPSIPDFHYESTKEAFQLNTSETARPNDDSRVSRTIPDQAVIRPIDRPTQEVPKNMVLPDSEDFKNTLIRIASERTGFEPDMLSLEANMETELGIDSIKKIEILSILREKYNLMNQLDEDQLIEEVADLITLGSVIDWFENKCGQMAGKIPGNTATPPQPTSYYEPTA